MALCTSSGNRYYLVSLLIQTAIENYGLDTFFIVIKCEVSFFPVVWFLWGIVFREKPDYWIFLLFTNFQNNELFTNCTKVTMRWGLFLFFNLVFDFSIVVNELVNISIFEILQSIVDTISFLMFRLSQWRPVQAGCDLEFVFDSFLSPC